MKSALLVDNICFACGVVDQPIENDVIALVERFEKEIRADQDKITRHACAESVNNIEYHHQGMGCGLEDVGITDRYEAMEHGFDEAVKYLYGAVMNTTAIKED